MRAVVYTECGPTDTVLKIAEIPDPTPGPNQVLIRIEASGINPHDTKKRSGWLPPRFPEGGIVPHGDGAGMVVGMGPGCDPGWLGRRVFFGAAPSGRGTAAELCAVDQAHIFKLPDTVSFAQGASLGVPAFTAWLCTLAHQPIVGQTILVHGGSGAVGRVIVEMASWAGARVIATAGSAERAKIPRDRGAEEVLIYPDYESQTALADRVLDLTSGTGVDQVIDVDFAAHLDCNSRVIRENGRLSSYSSSSNREPVFPYYAFALKGVQIDLVQGSMLTHAQRQAAGKSIVRLLDVGRIRPDVSNILPFADVVKAHQLVENSRAEANVVLDLGPEQKEA